jgi:hypothetical protein
VLSRQFDWPYRSATARCAKYQTKCRAITRPSFLACFSSSLCWCSPHFDSALSGGQKKKRISPAEAGQGGFSRISPAQEWGERDDHLTTAAVNRSG